MDFLTKIMNYFSSKSVATTVSGNTGAVSSKASVFSSSSKKQPKKNEISYSRDITDAQIASNNARSKYITVTKNPDYKVVNGDNIAKIAKKFGVEERTLLALNGLTKETGSKLRIGQTLKIPPTRKIKNVKNLNDVASSMGVSLDFIKRLKRVEDGNIGDNKFHNTPYKDKAGVLTIGIGHVVKSGEPQKLTDAEVCSLCANDLLRMEDNLVALLGQKTYDKLPQSMKEALLDMVFNKGTAVIENSSGLLYCLKEGKYEAAINKFTYNKNSKGEEMSGLSKRRLFDISVAIKMYNGKVPQSNINTAQAVYNRGIELLRLECKQKGLNFASQLQGYNNDVQSYLGNKIKLVTK